MSVFEPVVDELPDYIAAFIVFMREQPAITALCPANRITGELLHMPAMSWGIWIGKTGGDGSDRDVPILRVALELRTYGPTKREAMRLFRRVKPALEPARRLNVGFTRAGCLVYGVSLTSAPLEMVDPSDDTPFVISRWRADVSEVPQP